MKLLACHIENFGKLSDFSFDFSSKENVFCKENGWGKSTLAAFLKVMFYGFDTKKDKNALDKERKLYEPWQGGIYGGQVEFSAKGKSYRILRTFGKTEKADQFELFALDTGMESRDYSENLGEELFGLDAASFKRSIFIGQKEVLVESTDQIHAKLGNLVEHSNDMANFERAISQLKDEMNHLTPDRATGSIKRRKSEITQMQEDLKRFEAAEEGYRKTKEILAQKEEEKAKLEETKAQLTKTMRKLSAAGKNEAIRETYQAYQEDFAAKEEKVTLLKEGIGGSFPSRELLKDYLNKVFRLPDTKELEEEIEEIKRNHDKWNANVYLVAAILGAVIWEGIGLLLHSANPQFPTIGIHILVAVTLIIGVFLRGKGAKKEQERRSLLAEKKEEAKAALRARNELVAFLKHYGMQASTDLSNEELFGMLTLIQNQLNELENASALAAEARKRMESYAKQNSQALEEDAASSENGSLEQCQAGIAQVENDLEELRNFMESYRRNLKDLEDQMDAREELEQELDLAKEIQKEEQRKYELFHTTEKYLQAAKEGFNARYLEPISQGFARYYNLLTEDTTEWKIDSNMEMSRKELGLYRDTRRLSEGWKDMIGFCMRMALVDAMFSDEKPFLILDDPFTNLDGDKLDGARRLLEKLEADYQVIYFTCHESRLPA